MGGEEGGGGGHGEAEHVVAGGDGDVVEFGGMVDDGEAIVGHGSPAEPFLFDGLGVGFLQEFGGAGFEGFEAFWVDGGVVAGEFHGGAEAVSGLHGCDGDFDFLEDDGVLRADVWARHGDGVAFAGLDGDVDAELFVEEGGCCAGGD